MHINVDIPMSHRSNISSERTMAPTGLSVFLPASSVTKAASTDGLRPLLAACRCFIHWQIKFIELYSFIHLKFYGIDTACRRNSNDILVTYLISFSIPPIARFLSISGLVLVVRSE